MKKNCFYSLCAIATQLFAVGICYAQSATLALKSPSTTIVVDGNAQEWGDSLSYYNPEKKVHYTIANDKDNLYLVVKTNDPVQEGNILNAGITFSMDTKGRKKSAFSTTFPETTGSPAKIGNSVEEKTLFARFTKLKKIAVDGFKDISEEDINTTNDYGIHAAMDYDQQGNLVYEEAIPLSLFHAGDLAKNEWSFNLKINGFKTSGEETPKDPGIITTKIVGVPSGSGPPMGRRSSFKGVETNDLGSKGGQPTSAIDFWGKFNLAKAQ